VTFKQRPYDPDRRRKQSLAQRAATDRNFRIFRLHGLHAQLFLLTGPRRELAQLLIDQELTTMGALTTLEAQRRHIEKEMRRRANRPPEPCDECGQLPNQCECVPF
jgi:hypothetical protein